jgi:alkylated DNA repair dioxygenase AlkB
MTSLDALSPEPKAPTSPDSLFSVDSFELTNGAEDLEDYIAPEDAEDYSQGPQIDDCIEPAHHFDSADRSILPFPAVPGLYYLPDLIDHVTETEWMSEISNLNFFNTQSNNQMMFFSRPKTLSQRPRQETLTQELDYTPGKHSFLNWPRFLVDLIARLPALLSAVNPNNVDQLNDLLLGPNKADLPWQVIINLYRPGEGIEHHVDLVERFDEIILGISLGSNVAMEFERVDHHAQSSSRQKLYLKQRSGYIISRVARYDWTHGIRANQPYDYVCDSSTLETRKVLRVRTRLSITIRRLKSSADLLKD